MRPLARYGRKYVMKKISYKNVGLLVKWIKVELSNV